MKPAHCLLALSMLLQGQVLACDEPASDSSRIAIAGGSLTEIVYFLGVEDRIVATDSTSNFPQEASAFPSVGYVRNLSAEGLLSLDPTLVLGEHDMGPPEVLTQVMRTGVETVRVPEAQTAAGIVEKVRCVARLLDLEATAEQLIKEKLEPFVASLGRIASDADVSPPGVAFLLGLGGGVPLAAGSNTSGDGLLTMAGARNVFSNIDGWKQVSLEAMVSANPEIIVMPERNVKMAGGLEAVINHPAIRLTSAGKSRRIIVMDGMAMLGFGPRTLQTALQLATALHSPDLADTRYGPGR